MKVDNIQKYVNDKLNEGARMSFYKKFVGVKAVQGNPGEKIKTVLADGHVEVNESVVNVDEQGRPDWIVTNPSGERYPVPYSEFERKYSLEEENGLHKPIGTPILAIQIHEDIEFQTNHGLMSIRSGGYLNITNIEKGKVYGIDEKEFYKTCALCDKNGIFYDKALREAFGQEVDPEEHE